MLDLREQKSKPVLEQFKAWVYELLPGTPPNSALGKALAYTTRQWAKLTRYLQHAEIPVDYNYIERQIKHYATGSCCGTSLRRSWQSTRKSRISSSKSLRDQAPSKPRYTSANVDAELLALRKRMPLLRRREQALRAELQALVNQVNEGADVLALRRDFYAFLVRQRRRYPRRH